MIRHITFIAIALSIQCVSVSAYCTIQPTAPFVLNDGVSSWSAIDSNGFDVATDLGSGGSGLVSDLNATIGGHTFVEDSGGSLLIFADDNSFSDITLVRGSESVSFSGECTTETTTSENIISASEWWDIQVLEYLVMMLILSGACLAFILKIAR